MPKVNIRTTDIKNKLKGHRGVLIQMSELVLKLGLTMVGLIRFFTAKYRVKALPHGREKPTSSTTRRCGM